jgi:hypothetical protein
MKLLIYYVKTLYKLFSEVNGENYQKGDLFLGLHGNSYGNCIIYAAFMKESL